MKVPGTGMTLSECSDVTAGVISGRARHFGMTTLDKDSADRIFNEFMVQPHDRDKIYVIFARFIADRYADDDYEFANRWHLRTLKAAMKRYNRSY